MVRTGMAADRIKRPATDREWRHSEDAAQLIFDLRLDCDASHAVSPLCSML
jgi:hypothetical protein